MPTSEPESIVSVKLKKIEGEEKDCKDNDGRWQSWILSWDLFFVAFQGWDLLLEFFDFLGTLCELEPLPYAEGEREEEDGADGVDVAEAGKDDVSQLLHNTFWRVLMWVWLGFLSWCLVEILKMFDQDLCKNLW